MENTITLIKALADRNRARIVMALAQVDELCACQINALLQVAGATTSRHLALLVNAGMVKARKDGRWMHYRLAPTTDSRRELLKWLQDELRESDDIRRDRTELARITARDPEALCREQRGERCCPA